MPETGRTPTKRWVGFFFGYCYGCGEFTLREGVVVPILEGEANFSRCYACGYEQEEGLEEEDVNGGDS